MQITLGSWKYIQIFSIQSCWYLFFKGAHSNLSFWIRLAIIQNPPQKASEKDNTPIEQQLFLTYSWRLTGPPKHIRRLSTKRFQVSKSHFSITKGARSSGGFFRLQVAGEAHPFQCKQGHLVCTTSMGNLDVVGVVGMGWWVVSICSWKRNRFGVFLQKGYWSLWAMTASNWRFTGII